MQRDEFCLDVVSLKSVPASEDTHQVAAQGRSSEEGCEMSPYTQGEVRDSQGECVEWKRHRA